MKREHVFIYIDDEGARKFRGFFIDRPTAEKWVGKQEDPSLYEISDEPPPKRVVAEQQAEPDEVSASTDQGLDKALAAVRAAASE